MSQCLLKKDSRPNKSAAACAGFVYGNGTIDSSFSRNFSKWDIGRFKFYRMRLYRVCFLFLASFACLAVTGCTSFDHDWAKAARQPAPDDDVSGRWDGT